MVVLAMTPQSPTTLGAIYPQDIQPSISIFTILSDHKPLQHCFKESSDATILASAHMQRWALTLGAYDSSSIQSLVI